MLVVSSHLPTVVPGLVSVDWPTWGVNCFFILSGFLLAPPYIEALLDPSKGFPSTRLFLLRRFLRIYPLYALSVVISSVLLLFVGKPFPNPWNIAGHLLMLEDFSAATVYSINPPLWTMPVDAAFYLALPVIAFALSRAVRHVALHHRTTVVLSALAAIAAIGVSSRYLACRLEPSVLHDVATRYVYVHNAVGMAPSFAIGAFLALLALLAGRAHVPRLAVAGALVFAAVLDFAVRHMDIVYGGAPDHVLTSRIVWSDLVAALSVALVVFALEHASGTVTAALRSRTVQSLAALAYAIYLFHYPILQVVVRRFGAHPSRLVAAEEIIVALACTLAVAYVAHRFVEAPFLEIKDRKRDLVTAP